MTTKTASAISQTPPSCTAPARYLNEKKNQFEKLKMPGGIAEL